MRLSLLPPRPAEAGRDRLEAGGMSRKRAILGGALAALLSVASTTVSDPRVRRLSPGVPIEADISPGRIDAYAVSLGAGELLHLAIEQNHLDAAVRILDSGGTELAAADNSADESDPVTLSVIAPREETYRIEVGLRSAKSARGRYRLSIDPPRAAAAEDSKRIEGERLRSEGDALLARAAESTSRQALEKYEASIALWRAIGDRREEAATLDRITDTLGWLGDLRPALDRARQALALWKEIADRRGEASALDEVGVALLRTGDQRGAIDALGGSLAIRKEDRDIRGIAETLSNMANARSGLGDRKSTRLNSSH